MDGMATGGGDGAYVSTGHYADAGHFGRAASVECFERPNTRFPDIEIQAIKEFANRPEEFSAFQAATAAFAAPTQPDSLTTPSPPHHVSPPLGTETRPPHQLQFLLPPR
eukprot:2162221-Prymnesium_polylepis.1